MTAHDTSRGKLYDVIENWPDIRTHEMTWIKAKEGGKIIANAMRRNNASATPGFLVPKTRSRLHTHTTENNTIEDRRLATVPSPWDISSFLHYALTYANRPEWFVRVSHVIPISAEGKVTGFITLRIGKKLVETMQTDMGRIKREGDISTIVKETSRAGGMIKLLNKVDDMVSKYNEGVGDVEPFFAEYFSLIAELQQAGMQFRATPRKGYIFKDGYFQPKPRVR